MESLVKVATCNLNQWAMDFENNLSNVKQSIKKAKQQGARLRVGPELEITGYGCEDHFLEQDTFFHAWESLTEILDSDLTDGIVCDIGMPVLHRGVRYNCRVVCLNRRILLIRPKLYLADDGNYRETRWFTSWNRLDELDTHTLPPNVADTVGQKRVPFGIAVIAFNDAAVASETCEELFTPRSPHISLSLNGAEIICNGSGSHHSLRKLNLRTDLIISATAKAGGVYIYANQQGCDGGRLYYDGCSLVACNGNVLAQASQFSIKDLEVITAVIDLEEVRSYRGAISSRSKQASSEPSVPTVNVNFDLCSVGITDTISVPRPLRINTVEEEIAHGPSCWLWDYLRRSGASGFFLPLSGGADSSATATIVSIMCHNVMKSVVDHDEQVCSDVRRIIGEGVDMPTTPEELANRIFCTAYLGTSNNSQETRDRARDLAADIGCYHLTFNIDSVIHAILAVFSTLTGKSPQFSSTGGSTRENLALQNIQARVRMVFSFMLAQLLPWVRQMDGFLLVLGSANVDEALRGYMTKYDCSSGDINPIGGISKNDLKLFLIWASEHLGYRTLLRVTEAPPTAELEPITPEYTQTDEVDMEMSYSELGLFGSLRNLYRCGPLSMFERLKHSWAHMRPSMISEKVKRFFYYYSVNRHKLTVLTPSYHAEYYSPDDNRFDHRQFLYNTKWTRQFASIDKVVELHEASIARKTK